MDVISFCWLAHSQRLSFSQQNPNAISAIEKCSMKRPTDSIGTISRCFQTAGAASDQSGRGDGWAQICDVCITAPIRTIRMTT